MMQPGEMMKMQSISGGPIKGEEVYLNALILLKNIINDYWENKSEATPSEDKENVS